MQKFVRETALCCVEEAAERSRSRSWWPRAAQRHLRRAPGGVGQAAPEGESRELRTVQTCAQQANLLPLLRTLLRTGVSPHGMWKVCVNGAGGEGVSNCIQRQRSGSCCPCSGPLCSERCPHGSCPPNRSPASTGCASKVRRPDSYGRGGPAGASEGLGPRTRNAVCLVQGVPAVRKTMGRSWWQGV